MRCCFTNECFFCKKHWFTIYEIPIYNDFHHLYCCMTNDSYMACKNCIIKLIKDGILVFSLKSIVKSSVINKIIKSEHCINS